MTHAAESSVDVLVIGSGIAACAALLTLARYSCSVHMVAPFDKLEQKIGESLSPSANSILQSLGVWDHFLAARFTPGTTTFSAWQMPELVQQNSHPIFSAGGWIVERDQFEKLLHQSSVPRTYARVREAIPFKDGWRVELDNGNFIHARFVLDCSGRRAIFAKRMSPRHRLNRMVAAYAFLDHVQTDIEPTQAIMIEAVSNGWWYSAVTPKQQMVLAFYSDADILPACLKCGMPVECQTLTQDAPLTWRRLTSAGFSVATTYRVTDASTTVQEEIVGRGWAAVGDAAAALDPISSHGMTMALWMGQKAAKAAAQVLMGEYQLLNEYAHTTQQGLKTYQLELQRLYACVTRFDTPFWRRRLNTNDKNAFSFRI